MVWLYGFGFLLSPQPATLTDWTAVLCWEDGSLNNTSISGTVSWSFTGRVERDIIINHQVMRRWWFCSTVSLFWPRAFTHVLPCVCTHTHSHLLLTVSHTSSPTVIVVKYNTHTPTEHPHTHHSQCASQLTTVGCSVNSLHCSAVLCNENHFSSCFPGVLPSTAKA